MMQADIDVSLCEGAQRVGHVILEKNAESKQINNDFEQY
jgi:hypothetical protein